MSAIAFLRSGMALTPIPFGAKAPIARGWQLRANAVTGAENAGRFAHCNAGLLHAWSRTCAIDIDDYDAADAWLTDHGINLERLFCAEDAVTVSGRPGRGKLLYRLPEGLPLPTTRRIAEQGRVILEFRCASTSGESMQDVVSGLHPQGMPYTVTGDPEHMPVLPDLLLHVWSAPDPVQATAGGIPEGSRDDTLFKLARRMHNAGMREGALLQALREENAHCLPPLPEFDLRRIARSATTLKDRPDWRPAQTPFEASALIDPAALIAEGAALYRSGGLRRGDMPGWRAVDELYSVALGQWTIVTGIPQSGKSEWLDALLLNLASADPSWRFAMYSPENWPVSTHLVKLVEKRVGKPFGPGPTERMTLAEYEAAALWITQRFLWLSPEQCAPQHLVEGALRHHTEGGKFGIVLDPWNTLDHERNGLSETDYISAILTKVTRLVREAKAHCWLVVHPAKLYKDRQTGKRDRPSPYDISGSAHWYNKADNIVTVHRDQTDDTQDVEIHVQKVRFKHIGHIGMATLKYDRITGRYFEAPTIYDPISGRAEQYREASGG